TLTGRNVVVDPRVKGTITLTTERPVSPAVAYSQFLATLRLQGFTVVNSAGLDKIVPEADAKLQGGAVSTEAPLSGGQIATTIFRLDFENANNLLPILRPLISPNNTINVNPGNNTLVITDYADNLNRLGRIIAALDVANATDVEIIPVKNASVTDIAPLVTRLLESSAPGTVATAEASYRTTVIAEPRSNSLIVRAANAARMGLVKSLVQNLDKPLMNGPNGEAGNIYVVYLKNADATRLATVLRAALAGSSATSSGSQGLSSGMASTAAVSSATATPTGGGGAAQGSAIAPLSPSAGPSTGGQIQADTATNSLIITASEPQYRQLRAVIEKLDARRAQVYVESLIAEVNMDKAAEFGIQWQGPIGGKGDSLIGLLGTNFGSGGKNIINLAAQADGKVAPSTGLNLGVAAQRNGVYFLGFLANFLQTTGAGNILSTPNLLTLDNEEARIVIGQNVPFVTGQFTNTGSGGSNGAVNPFQTIERKDVGLTLRVKPQISENGTVKMSIFQEVSSVQPGSINSATGLITNKRSIESNVLVEDGSIIVLGGLLQDEYSGNQDQVPGLGDVPLFGNLFKSESRSRKKSNLMVFLRPVVVRDGAATDALSMDRYDMMRTRQQQAQPASSSLIPVNESPVLPMLTPGLPTSIAAPNFKTPIPQVQPPPPPMTGR
ncbi:MAG: type II secretion system secretin GspD, partial [Polaromonas sp.]